MKPFFSIPPRAWVLLLCVGLCGHCKNSEAFVVSSDDPLFACVALRATPLEEISEAVSLINELPKPTTIPCFLAALARPLSLVATRGTLSAQPAAGPGSPRVFILTKGLVMSVVSDGTGAELLEFGEWTTPTRTIKGEIKFPVSSEIDNSEPYVNLPFNDSLTSCAFCHRDEEPHPQIEGGFVSVAYQPETTEQILFSTLLSSVDDCDAETNPGRCEHLRALLQTGDVVEGFFEEEVLRLSDRPTP